jgi:transposase
MNESTHKSPRRFDKEFKAAALELWRTSGKTRKEVADELGISEWNLRDWKEDVERGNTPAAVLRPRTMAELEADNLRLRQEVASLRNQRDILKKSLGILCEPPGNGSRT